jgi:lantibiotic modifying enzyme
MILDESASTNKKENTTVNKNNQSKILHASMVPIGIDMIAKAKIAAPKSKGDQGKGGRKNISVWHDRPRLCREHRR